MLGISGNIAPQFLPPVAQIRFGPAYNLAGSVTMLMPETTVHEYDFAAGWKDEIRLAWQALDMKSIPITKPVHQSADLHLGLHPLASDTPHIITALLSR
jgi:hypothetical protein